jgi:hypothetical protein
LALRGAWRELGLYDPWSDAVRRGWERPLALDLPFGVYGAAIRRRGVTVVGYSGRLQEHEARPALAALAALLELDETCWDGRLRVLHQGNVLGNLERALPRLLPDWLAACMRHELRRYSRAPLGPIAQELGLTSGLLECMLARVDERACRGVSAHTRLERTALPGLLRLVEFHPEPPAGPDPDRPRLGLGGGRAARLRLLARTSGGALALALALDALPRLDWLTLIT